MSLQFPTRNKQDTITADGDYKDWSTSEDDEENTNITTSPNFADVIESINSAIAKLGGDVIPKLTWSVPKDASWVSVGNTLRCSTADQVLLLLKSSDRIAHDLEDALAQCTTAGGENKIIEIEYSNNGDDGDTRISNEDITTSTKTITNSTIRTNSSPPGGHILALRKWYDLKPGREFRCFVLSGRLRGISQRDVSRRYEELESEFESIKNRIEQFHQKYISSSRSSGDGVTTTLTGVSSLGNYTYDCYVPTTAESAVKIIDFNPAGGTTASLFFNWEELYLKENIEQAIDPAASTALAMDEDDIETAAVEFRILKEDVAMRPDTALYGVPYDFVDYSEGSALRSLIEQAQRGNASDNIEE
jgi:hypothetical protein